MFSLSPDPLAPSPCSLCHCRKAFIETLQAKFADFGLTYAIGGQISFDVFPQVRAAK